MNRIPQEKIDRIREATDIADLVSQYLPLKRTGKYLRALCPFHAETSPSFFVSPEKQIYHCFGCGAGGNVFTFLMEYEKVSFVEAVRTLARRAGISLPERGARAGGYDHLYRANEFACQLYRKILKGREGRGAGEYLLKRGIGEDVQEEFKLGFAPSSWDRLLREAKTASISGAVLKAAGLAAERKEGGYYDWFRNRVLFPISNLSGRTIGFGGRVIDDSLPKYLNSPDTPVYKKGAGLYGLYHAKSEIRRNEEVVVVEGYTDLLALWQAGFKNVVASLGTALTQSQAKLLSRYARKVILTYDPDQPGVEAILRGGDILLQVGIGVGVLLLPPNEDPDLFLRTRGGKKFGELMSQPQDFMDFKINHLASIYDLSSIEGKVEVARRMASSLARIPDEVRRGFSLQRVAKSLSIGEDVLLAAFPKGAKSERGVDFSVPQKAPYQEELQLIGLVARRREILPLVESRLSLSDLCSESSKRLMGVLLEAEAQGRYLEPASLLDLLEANERRVISETLLCDADGADWEKMASDLISRIRGAKIEAKLGELKRQIESAERRGESRQDLLRHYQQLAQERVNRP